ncbi:N-formylglutamate amidohydrolase [Terrihabitans rhizophilus]|uniref:N-formylglutamate amidohydrolase n=1 Tax=Terrihabitans rhizophilus TaxID=3092662 RepID=A0ABU4RPA3_9HYPH|nr:N-formylglutamate amidohydrolase [Terrihabitans sp. PJ23]MDX6806676.1 N-formylglutamate amidohydrolase [Terrihabitans sp. PJ23]
MPEPYRAPVEIVPGASSDVLLLCDHATNAVPAEFGHLGLPLEQFQRHIAYDIGAAAVTRELARLLGATAIFSGFSRLLIDPNRGPDDPTLVMRLSDGAVIPGNARIGAEGIAQRIAHFHAPYHEAIARHLDIMAAADQAPAIIAVHSFTPVWKTEPRPWHAAVLWDRDPRLACPLIDSLRQDGKFEIGDNEPYDGALENDTLYRHGTKRGLPHALIEVRQDLISDDFGAGAWANRLATALAPLIRQPDIHKIEQWGSRADMDPPIRR